MQERNSPSRFASVPLGHKLIAFLLAAGVAWGGYTWLHRRAVLTASAAHLSFDPRAARTLDSGLAIVHDPALALAQSVLTDQEVEQLASSAQLSSTSVTGRMGEFRSRLQLTEPTANTLSVRFLGKNGVPSIPMANSVAQALADWTPTLNAAPLAPPPSTHAAPPRSTPPVRTPPVSQPNPSASALAASLGDLEGLLSSTKSDLDNIGYSGAGGQHRSDPAAYRESDQQHLIKARVGAAEQKLESIRSSPAAKSSPASSQIAEMQQAVASILSAGRVGGFAAAGVDAAQIRRERAQLDDAIAVVHRDRLAVQKEEAGAADETTAPPPSSTAAAPPPQQNPAPAETNLPPASHDILPNPLTFTSSAAAPAPTPWWPSVVAGLVCGLLYWSIAALADREPAYEEIDTAESTGSIYNFITAPAAPSLRPEPEPTPRSESWTAAPAAPPIAPQLAPQLAHHASPRFYEEEEIPERSSRRASFRFEPAAHESAAPESVAQPEPEPEPTTSESHSTPEPAPELQAQEPQPPESASAHDPISGAGQTISEHISARKSIFAPDPLFDFFAPSHPPAVESPASPAEPGSSDPPPHLSAEPLSAPGPRALESQAMPEPFTLRPAAPRPLLSMTSPPADGKPHPAASLPEALLLASDERAPHQENVVELPDTWVDDVRRAIAQTEIGRRFEEVPAAEAPAKHETDGRTQPARTDRLAG
ncbi:MAG TPA: hypothetical protein VHX37_16275 [Acidobacteriaceae bacterium]|jgi:hypothetical protein|nr:hypothetical protein [Acidobacteriaceae bacterium]